MEIDRDSRKRGFGKTALIADDNRVIRKMVAAALLSDGFRTCDEVANGQEAVEVAEQCRPDLVILDLSMPVMNGLDAASRLHKLLPKTPIILFTSYEDSLSKEYAAKAGVSLVLPKTLPLPTLIDKAHELMNG